MQPQWGSLHVCLPTQSTHCVPCLCWGPRTEHDAHVTHHPCLQGAHSMDTANLGVELGFLSLFPHLPADCVTSGERLNLSGPIFSSVKRATISSLAESLGA